MSDSQDAAPSSPTSTNSKEPIVLQVGEQCFRTLKSTLEGSTFLRSLTEDRWSAEKQADGSYFLDQDPELFKHVLRFLRHGIFPLCYDKGKGHDFATYDGIRIMAEFLGVKDLATWLNAKQYLSAVSVKANATVVEEECGLSGNTASNIDVEYYPSWNMGKKYVCPRGLARHYGDPNACGRACRNAQGGREDVYEEVPVLSTLVVKKHTVFLGGL
ncbi:MAG: hypothetical protein Q9183_005459, partial [Haloplaca sp. 2 TL-2023]